MNRSQRRLAWLLAVVLAAMVGFTIVVFIIASQNRQTAQQACLGASARTAQQLNIDYVIYRSVRRRADAVAVLAGIQAIALVRVDRSVAGELPTPLASIVRRVDFHCR